MYKTLSEQQVVSVPASTPAMVTLLHLSPIVSVLYLQIANSKSRYFYESSANQSSMEIGLCGFQYDSLCDSLLCTLSTLPTLTLVLSERCCTEGVRCSSLPWLWTQELRTLLQQQGHLPLTSIGLYAAFAPFVNTMLMQPVTLLLFQLGSLGNSALSVSCLYSPYSSAVV